MNIMILILCFIWGFNFIVMKIANQYFSPVYFVTYRFLIGTIFLFCIVFIKKIPFPSKNIFKWYILCGLLQTAYFNLAIQISLNYISAGLVSVMTYSMPLFFCILAHFFIPGEKLSPVKTLGILIGLIGLCFALNISNLTGNVWTFILGISSAISWAFSNLIVRKKLTACNKIQFTAWQMLFGTTFLFIYLYIHKEGFVIWNSISIGCLLFSGIIASALAFSLWTYILSKVKASKASTSLLLIPIIGILFSYLFFKETLKVSTIIGIILVVSGVFLVNNDQLLKN